MTQSSLASRSGISYIAQGFQLITQPGLRLFVMIPLLANILLFGGAFVFLYQQLGGWVQQIMDYLPSWLDWLSWLIWPSAIIAILMVFGFTFSIIGNWIAAPFNGLLAEKVELHLSGKKVDDMSFVDLIKDLPRIFSRELQKLWYWLPKALGLLLLFLIPAIGQTVAPVLWFLFTAWMMSIQYIDYPFDNHRIPFDTMRDHLKQDRIRNSGFGAIVLFCSTVPLLNLIIMPVAVCGATAIWVDVYRKQLVEEK
ncbi:MULTISPECIES: sulfate transporter CysZ [unclassified Agarivorans]|uniref:sulfate transporter CysZ n=1 Tax=unclassified Agarivorans TaxID=2636026 RepID=UPI0010E52991|nr:MULTISPECIES: sulfate transporter CysZ [unclassified Agarivorans]MDO6687991.1 sulfate transporter CysZ [Agarivorans sp. 3_MG-2023]MDO6717592.1 sulfate transporter CysZ [Agarivorans sp. 2_MG-2023]MDO6766024.1 sulfate transporter CysZ [Agarivorans sp. 1_MG-2023]GDY27848.1 sulfate transporter CysZ [Agarivorans sp. Toyoura001]